MSFYFDRAIAIADFILEDGGHTIAEAAKEFCVSRSTIKRALKNLDSTAFYGQENNAKELQLKYLNVRKTLDHPNKKNRKSQKAASN